MAISSTASLSSNSYTFSDTENSPTRSNLYDAMKNTAIGTSLTSGHEVVSFNVTFRKDNNDKLYAVLSVTHT